MDPHFRVLMDAQAAAAAGQEAPPLDVIPPDMVRAGYRMERTSQNQNAPKDVEVRDLQVDGAAGPIGARLYTPKGAATVTPGSFGSGREYPSRDVRSAVQSARLD